MTLAGPREPTPKASSGGALCSNPTAVNALIRVAEASGPVQVPDAYHALATGVGGISQFYTAMVLGSQHAERFATGPSLATPPISTLATRSGA